MRKRCILSIHFCGIRPRKKSMLKMNNKKILKNNFRILKKKNTCVSSDQLKNMCKVSKL